ncbi:MAG TPA: hypothetical protein VI197_21585 [Polyangiaceae bacterium]
MRWYVSVNGESFGPNDDAQVVELARTALLVLAGWEGCSRVV